MRKSKNLDASMVPKNYPNIAKIFTKEWFESEFWKEKEEMHSLARQFTYDENDRSSLHLIDHLEEYLATMQDEIKRNKKHFYDTLRHRDQYKSSSAEIEIASLFKTLTPHHVGDMPHNILSFADQTLNRTDTFVFSYSPYRE